MIPHSQPTIEADDIRQVIQALKEKHLNDGKITTIFSEKIKKFFLAKKVFLTTSGTEALTLALRLMNLSSDDQVIIPAYVCSNVARAVINVPATPIAADINSDDYNLSYHDATKKINQKTKAIILVNLFGNPIDELSRFRQLNIPIIEDIAQGIGGQTENKKWGSFGNLAVCSFGATKLITTGCGGALIINDQKWSRSILLADSNFTDLQAALGLSQLTKLDRLIRKRRVLAKRLLRIFNQFSLVQPQSYHPKKIYYRLTLRLKTNKIVPIINKFNQKGVGAARFTDLVLNYLNLQSGNFPITARVVNELISMPIYPSLSESEIKKIIKVGQQLLT